MNFKNKFKLNNRRNVFQNSQKMVIFWKTGRNLFTRSISAQKLKVHTFLIDKNFWSIFFNVYPLCFFSVVIRKKVLFSQFCSRSVLKRNIPYFQQHIKKLHLRNIAFFDYIFLHLTKFFFTII